MDKLYIGLMSGTSLDGIDASIIKTDGKNNIVALEDLHIPYSEVFKSKCRKLMETNFGFDFLKLENEFTELHIMATLKLLSKAGLKPSEISAIGFHGQTIYHNPTQKITWQIGNPFMLAAKTEIKTVYDFRKRDIARGGQGAPLIPIFHKAIMNGKEKPVAVVNIGGVANITYIDHDELIAFDTGPGNALIDDACQRYYDKSYDTNGETARAGKPHLEFVNSVLKQEYFSRPYPKSLDRNEFRYISEELNEYDKRDIISTLTYLTASAIALSLKSLPKPPIRIYLCGGGAHNSYLVKLIDGLVNKTYKCEILPMSTKTPFKNDFIESQGFAYLAARCLNGLPSAFPSATGASKENICGLIVEP